MDTQPTFNPNDLLANIVGDVANAISERAGESPNANNMTAARPPPARS